MKISLRNLYNKDLDLLYFWRNHPITRSNSLNQSEISLTDHKKWFDGVLKNDIVITYIMEVSGIPAGVIRFDIDPLNGKTAKISYLIDPSQHGRGLGTNIVKRGIEKISKDNNKLENVFGHVLKQNLASIRIFEKLSFKKVSEDTSELKFEKPI